MPSFSVKSALLRQAFPTRRCFAVDRRFTSASALDLPDVRNEPVLEYKRGSDERAALEAQLDKMYNSVAEIPVVIGEREIFTDSPQTQNMPFDFNRPLAKYSHANKALVTEAIQVGMDARESTGWERMPLRERAAVLLRAADLCAGERRMELNAATMLGQAKTVVQAEIDAAAELVDFLRFNALFAIKLLDYQPISTDISTNKLVYRALDGFVAAIAPFNFTAISGNLASCPALMGNTVMWKPSNTAVLSSYIIFKALRDAGMPPGVINFLPSRGADFGSATTGHPLLAGVNFTGSVPTFRQLWRDVAHNLDSYITFPRLIGECGGKNFHFIHNSADLDMVAACTVRAAFEYQGQKCSACSRMYVPESIWPQLRDKILSIVSQINMGDPRDFSTFMTAVIDRKAFERIRQYIEHAKTSSNVEILCGGKCDDSKGFFIEPTLVQTTDPRDILIQEEIFGPVLTAYVYPDSKCDEMLTSVKDAAPFGLTGAVIAEDRAFLDKARSVLRDAVGNLYINDKCTGSVVGQQPFGGGRLSGTNDKAGGPHYVLRWASPQTIKETSAPQHQWKYPHME